MRSAEFILKKKITKKKFIKGKNDNDDVAWISLQNQLF